MIKPARAGNKENRQLGTAVGNENAALSQTSALAGSPPFSDYHALAGSGFRLATTLFRKRQTTTSTKH
jgi:hypothetical protein